MQAKEKNRVEPPFCNRLRRRVVSPAIGAPFGPRGSGSLPQEGARAYDTFLSVLSTYNKKNPIFLEILNDHTLYIN